MDKDFEEIQRKIAAIQGKHAELREENRRRFPDQSRVIDMFNAAGVGPIKVLRIRDADRNLLLGKPDTEHWIPWRIYEPPHVVRSKPKTNRKK